MNQDETKDFLRRKQQIVDLGAVMDSPEGRRFVWRMLSEAGVFRPSFIAGAADVTAFNEGSRNFGLILLAEIMAELPESFLIMQREAVNHEQYNKRNAQSNSGSGDTDY